MTAETHRRRNGRVWVGVRDALRAHPLWLPIVVIALALTLLRPARQGAPAAQVTPWFLVLVAVAALPFALNPLVDKRKRRGQQLIGGSLPRTPPPKFEPDRGWAAVWILAPFVALAVGVLLYRAHAPDEFDAPAVALGGSAQTLPPAVDLGLALVWDAALIVGYGTALWMGVVAASWVFWTPTAAAVARFGRPCVAVAVTADLVENLLLAWAWRDGTPFLLDAASVAARIKFAMLLPAVLIALSGVLVTAGRLLGSTLRAGRNADVWATITDDGQTTPRLREGSPQTAPSAAEGTAAASPDDEAQRRWAAAYDVPDVEPDGAGSAFCLSGGGIRSACVSLGVLNGLRSKLTGVRYVIAVSGGSYTAGALSQLLSAAPDAWLPANAAVQGDFTDAYAPGSVELDHLRRHSSYITSTPREMIVALAVLARGVLASLALLFAPAVLLGILVAWLYHALPIAVLPKLGGAAETSSTGALTSKAASDGLVVPPQAAWTALIVTVIAVVAWVWQLSGQARVPAQSGPPSRKVTRPQRVAVFSTQAAVLVVVAVLGLPVLLWVATWVAGTVAPRVQVPIGVGGAVGSVLLTYAASLAVLLWRKRTSISGALTKRRGKDGSSTMAAVPRGLLQLLLVVLALAVLYLGWLLLFGVSASATVTSLDACDRAATLAGCDRSTPLLAAAGIAVLVAVLGAVLDESSLSLHPFYRQRLASAFATRRVSIDGGPTVAIPYDAQEPTTLSEYTGSRSEPQRPIFVYGAAANLNGDHRTPPGLNAVSFTFSSQWCGGPDIGWVQTDKLEKIVSTRLRRDITVQGAVAISGAAIASAMGRNSGWYDVFLAASGVRLGAWLPNPSFLAQMRAARDEEGVVDDWTLPGLPRVRRMTYLLREVLNLHSDCDRLLLISDGGHYENLGLVEALRRRCTTIYLADGGGDRPPTAQGLVEAINLAYAELGVVIELDDPLASEPGGGGPLRPEAPLQALNAGLSRTPVITGTITYPEAAGLPKECNVGRLYVARSTLWPTMPYSLLSYAARHPEFPRDSTGDQWFDDGQFSAYLNLGRAMGDELAEAAAADACPRDDPVE
jgi:hypothetical protein